MSGYVVWYRPWFHWAILVTMSYQRLERGIAKTPHGYRVHVRVRGTLYSKRFPPDTSIYKLREWVTYTRGRVLWKGLHDLPEPLPALPKSPDGWCYLYVIMADNAAKIGRAVDPHQRLRELQTGHPAPLTLVAAAPAHAALERAAHLRFAHLKMAGEWFRIEADLAVFIRELQEGKNPIAILWDEMRPSPAPPEKPRWKFRTT